MITSERQYKDLTVIRETERRVGADWRDHPEGEETYTVRVERRCGANGVWAGDHTEIIMPTEPLFSEAVAATALAEKMSEIGAKGGSSRSKAKAKANRANGAKGGRPTAYRIEVQTESGAWVSARMEFGEDFADRKTRAEAEACIRESNKGWEEEGGKTETMRVVPLRD